jgi:hypothetical protein
MQGYVGPTVSTYAYSLSTYAYTRVDLPHTRSYYYYY